MEHRTILIVVTLLVSLNSAMCRSLNHHHRSHLHNSYHNHHPHSSDNSNQQQKNQSYEDYEEDEDDARHAYLMTKDFSKTSIPEVTEDQVLAQAFHLHMKATPAPIHDVYAYQLPSELWFVVRYKNTDGQVRKYMNIVDSFTNYLEKLDKDVRTVSVNVKGVETVFRLTPKRKPGDN